MRFQKGKSPSPTTEAEIEIVRAFDGETFLASGVVIASGVSHWSNRRGSRGHDRTWVLAMVQGFDEPVYATTTEHEVYARGEEIELEITPTARLARNRDKGDRFDVQIPFSFARTSTQRWEDVVDLLKSL